ncbi:hypothetical protein [Nitrosomonas sp. Nm34]|uniref:hypothetical protein n=1 Tax=Nitrosomonas sp. Nm34 TaxID=1881055 RepID=UPI0008EB9829|nr:hypothetical protein [Nitrosomonas sp. Nm34]SFI50026.1 solute carrier family 13 (sodium-dependent dicarboxylate transporter), member 2/3/5 [Nitrosomonas sp. Nm34]
MHIYRQWAFIAGPLLAAGLAASMSFYGWDAKACWTGIVVMLCVIWWIFEPVPIPVIA